MRRAVVPVLALPRSNFLAQLKTLAVEAKICQLSIPFVARICQRSPPLTKVTDVKGIWYKSRYSVCLHYYTTSKRESKKGRQNVKATYSHLS